LLNGSPFASPSLGVAVRLEDGLPAVQLEALSASSGVSLRPTNLPGVLQATGTQRALAGFSRLATMQPGVETVEPVSTVSIAAMPNDPAYQNGQLWGLAGSPGIGATTAWDTSTGGTSVVVASIDTGVDYNHVDLYQNIWINQAEIPATRLADLADIDGDGLITFHDLNDPANQGSGKITDLNGDGRIDGSDILAPLVTDASGKDTGQGGWSDGVDAESNGFTDDLIGWNFLNNTNNPMDDNNHGTHTTGTMAAMGNNGTGVTGVAWTAQVMVLKFLDASGNGTDLAAAEAIRYAADEGARVSNNSWGGGSGSSVLRNAIVYAGNLGQIVVAAAGNQGQNDDSTPFYPASFDLDNIISVAALNRDGSLASYSNYGVSTVDLAAPGTGIISTIRNDRYGTDSGTSMATPFVTGTILLVWAKNPSWTEDQVIHQILATAKPGTALAGKTVTGGFLSAAEAVPPPLVKVSLSGPGGSTAAQVTEGTGTNPTVTFTVHLSAPSSQPVSVSYSTANGTALAGHDYQAASGTVVFNPGETDKTIVITILGDSIDESDESFSITLGQAVGASLGAAVSGSVTIVDDDAPPKIAAADLSILEGDSGLSTARFIVSLSQASGKKISVVYKTADGTATAGSDYDNVAGTLTFLPGQTTAFIDVPIHGDSFIEPDETFAIRFSSPVNASFARNFASARIRNDDVSVSIGDARRVEGDSGSAPLNFTISLSTPVSFPVSVVYNTADGTALNNQDYNRVYSTTVTFQPGQTNQTVAVSIKGDRTVEPDETFTVRLLSSSNATIGRPEGTGTIINDDLGASKSVRSSPSASGASFRTADATSGTSRPSANRKGTDLDLLALDLALAVQASTRRANPLASSI
jgi:subtilisin family serine protease